MDEEKKTEIQLWILGVGFIIIGLVLWVTVFIFGPVYPLMETKARVISLSASVLIALIGLACELIGIPIVRKLIRSPNQLQGPNKVQ